MNKKPTQPTTIVITNFGGRLTRILNGDLNSGLAKFTSSFGYDPFSKPMNLTWLEQPTSVAGILDIPQTGKVLSSNNEQGPNTHVIDQSGNWYQIISATLSNNNLNSVIGISSIKTQTYNFGTSMEFFGSVVGTDLAGNQLGRLYVGGDSGIKSINPDGSGESTVGVLGNYTQNVYHPLQPFAGTLVFGNGNTIGQIGATNTVISSIIGTGTGGPIYSSLNPPLETQAKVLDLEVTPSNDYVVMASSNIVQEERLDENGRDIVETYGSQQGRLAQWNGTDQGVTAATNVPTYLLSSIQTYFKNMAFFASDTFGSAFNDGSSKILTLPGNKPPAPNGTAINANFMTWISPEVVGAKRYLSLYYFGALDSENPSGLYRVLRWSSPQVNSFISKATLNLVVSNQYLGVNLAQTAVMAYGFGKHYLGVNSINGDPATVNFLLSFLITPTGTGTPQLGVYETQTQLFSKRIGISQIRVYTEPTVTGNAFQLDLIGADGSVVPNGTYVYRYGEITDPQSGAISLERINFPGNTKTQYSLGVRLTNLGTVNMTIKKTEIDLSEEGK